MADSDLLGRLDALGGFFRLAAPDDGLPWRPLAELVGSPVELRRRAEELAARLGSGGRSARSVDARVAASTMHLGLAARLISPPLGMLVLGGVVPVLDPRTWSWCEPRAGDPAPALRAPAPIRFYARRAEPRGAEPRGAEPRGAEPLRAEPDVAAFVASVLVPVLLPLEESVRRASGVSQLVLRGNLLSALVGAAGVLAAVGPGPARAADAVVARLVRIPEFAGRGGFDDSGRFRRRSCCLYYRLPGGALCGDCVLAGPAPDRRRPGARTSSPDPDETPRSARSGIGGRHTPSYEGRITRHLPPQAE